MKYRNNSEALEQKICLTDGGLETVLMFEHGIDLPAYASFAVFDRDDGEQILRNYLEPYIHLAIRHQLAFQLVDSGWRANRSWGERLGLGENDLEKIIRRSIRLMTLIREEYETETTPMPIIGCIGPRGDGYQTGKMMSTAESAEYHHTQIATLADSEADFATAMTLTYASEGAGVILAAKNHSIPVTVSFTVETDGRLPSGESLAEAIEKCDAETGNYAKGFMINCAHPSHFRATLKSGGEWIKRIRGIRANASQKSHTELENAGFLDRGSPTEFGKDVSNLREVLPALRVIGGCCGTDIEHLTELAAALQ